MLASIWEGGRMAGAMACDAPPAILARLSGKRRIARVAHARQTLGRASLASFRGESLGQATTSSKRHRLPRTTHRAVARHARLASRLAGRKSACTFDGSGLQSGERRSHKGSRLMLLAGRCWPRACWAIGLTAAAWRAGGGSWCGCGLVCGYAGTSSALLRNSCEFWRVVFPYTFVLFFQNIGNMYPRTRKIIVA